MIRHALHPQDLLVTIDTTSASTTATSSRLLQPPDLGPLPRQIDSRVGVIYVLSRRPVHVRGLTDEGLGGFHQRL